MTTNFKTFAKSRGYDLDNPFTNMVGFQEVVRDYSYQPQKHDY